MTGGLADALTDYVEARFAENQGVALDEARSADPAVRTHLRQSLKPVVERIEHDWFGGFRADEPINQPDPWWTSAERLIVREIAEGAWSTDRPFIQKATWPGGQPYAAVISHDVDTIHPEVVFSTRRIAAHARLRRANLMGHGLCISDFDEVAELDREMSVPSTFFLMTHYDCLDSSQHRDLVRRVRSAGFEVGLHATPESATREDIIRREVATLEGALSERVRGVRVHQLTFDPAVSWRIQGAAGFEYDSTFARNRGVGFPTGSALPFRAFDLAARHPLDLAELPLAYMDWTSLQGEGATGMRPSLQGLAGAVRGVSGVLVVNFHNTYLSKHTHPDSLAAYRWLLDTLSRDGAWIARAGDLIHWWRMRADAVVTVRIEHGRTTIRNPGAIPLAVSSASDSKPRILRGTLLRSDEVDG